MSDLRSETILTSHFSLVTPDLSETHMGADEVFFAAPSRL